MGFLKGWKVRPTVFKIFNALALWLCFAAIVAIAISLGQVFSGVKINYDAYNLTRYLDLRLWLGQIIGGGALLLLYKILGEHATDEQRKVFFVSARSDVYAVMASFGWLFILCVPFALKKGEHAVGLTWAVLGLVNLIAVYFSKVEV